MAGRKGKKPPVVVVPPSPTSIWDSLTKGIREGKVIPIISNSFINNLVFDIDGDYRIGATEGETADECSVEEEYILSNENVAESWAMSLKYPLKEETYKLSRVAQYNHAIADSPDQAKANYLTFLKRYLLTLARGDDQVKHIIEALEQQIDDLSFADLAHELGYPRYDHPEQENPLYQLAALPLKYYLTTSQHDFLERTLKALGKNPKTQLCYWHIDRSDIPEEEKFTPPTVKEPLVYHLYGIEQKPLSIVISEDDFMDFLVKVSEDKDILPVQLRGAMAESSLLLLGYRLRDWELQVLLRGIIKPSTLRGSNLAIQFDQPAQFWEDSEKPDQDAEQEARGRARRYLEDYFKELTELKVKWADTTSFVGQLSVRYKENQQ